VSCGTLTGVETLPRQPHTDADSTPPAPGDLELVRAFLSVHDHVYGTRDSLPPSTSTIAWWLAERGLIDADARRDDADLHLAADVLEALRSRVRENMGGGRDPDAIRVLDDAARRTGLTVRFGSDGLTPTTDGVRGALGRILAAAFLSELDGTWARFKECSGADCRSVFWDRSKNRSGRWCTMKDCGNRAKVRAYRERERSTA
jgi:predicted RNA-binding Zn ribbon-like protein